MIAPDRSMDGVLSKVLGAGTCGGCAVIALGWLLTLTSSTGLGDTVEEAGVLLFILLPLVRLLSMAAMFARARNPIYVAITITVLLIIASGSIVASSSWGAIGN